MNQKVTNSKVINEIFDAWQVEIYTHDLAIVSGVCDSC